MSLRTSFIRVAAIALLLSGIAPASSALSLSPVEFRYSAVVTEVIEDPAGTIEFPGIAAGDRFIGHVVFVDPENFRFTTDIGVSLSRPPSSTATGAVFLSNTTLAASAGYDELQIEIMLQDPLANLLGATGPIDTTGFAINSVVFTEGAFDTIVRGRIEELTIVPEPSASLLFAFGLAVATATSRASARRRLRRLED